MLKILIFPWFGFRQILQVDFLFVWILMKSVFLNGFLSVSFPVLIFWWKFWFWPLHQNPDCPKNPKSAIEIEISHCSNSFVSVTTGLISSIKFVIESPQPVENVLIENFSNCLLAYESRRGRIFQKVLFQIDFSRVSKSSFAVAMVQFLSSRSQSKDLRSRRRIQKKVYSFWSLHQNPIFPNIQKVLLILKLQVWYLPARSQPNTFNFQQPFAKVVRLKPWNRTLIVQNLQKVHLKMIHLDFRPHVSP